MGKSRNKSTPKSKFETRLFKASEAELAFRVLANPRLEATARLMFLDELGEDSKLVWDTLAYATKKSASYGISEKELKKTAKAEMVIEDLKSLLSYTRLDGIRTKKQKT